MPVAAALDGGSVTLDSLFVHGQAFVTLELDADDLVQVTAPRGNWALAAFPAGSGEELAVDSGAEPVLSLRAGSWVLAITNLGPDGFDGDDDPYVATAPRVGVGGAGCGCSSGRGRAGPGIPLLALLALLPRRRRRGARSPMARAAHAAGGPR